MSAYDNGEMVFLSSTCLLASLPPTLFSSFPLPLFSSSPHPSPLLLFSSDRMPLLFNIPEMITDEPALGVERGILKLGLVSMAG